MKKDAIETLIKVAAALATRRPLHAIDELCDNQKQVSSARLYDMVEVAGDELAGYAVSIRQAVDALDGSGASMRAILQDQLNWHEARDKELSKSGRSDGDYHWRRISHKEQIENIITALQATK